MQLSFTWKLFGIANYILFISFLFFFGLLIFFAGKNGIASNELISFLPAVSGMLFISLNSILNLYIFYKYFPAKSLTGRIKNLYFFSSILYSLSLLMQFVLFYFAFSEELKNKFTNNAGILLLSIFLFLIITAVFVLWKQIQVKKVIEKNYKATLLDMIEDLGR